jgi:hypothetical protein
MHTKWRPSSTSEAVFEGRHRATAEIKWTGTRVDLLFGSNSPLRANACTGHIDRKTVFHALFVTSISDRIRDHVRLKYVEPARLSHQHRFSVRCGTVEKELGLSNRTPQVYTALRSTKFLDPNGLRLVETSGPPSGTSTTVVYTYEFRDSDVKSA